MMTLNLQVVDSVPGTWVGRNKCMAASFGPFCRRGAADQPGVSSAMNWLQGLVSTERNGSIENRRSHNSQSLFLTSKDKKQCHLPRDNQRTFSSRRFTQIMGCTWGHSRVLRHPSTTTSSRRTEHEKSTGVASRADGGYKTENMFKLIRVYWQFAAFSTCVNPMSQPA